MEQNNSAKIVLRFVWPMLLAVCILIGFGLKVFAVSDNFIIQASSGGESVDSIRYVHYQDEEAADSGLVQPANNANADSTYWQDTVTVDNTLDSRVLWRWYYHGQAMTTEWFPYSAPYAGDADSVLTAIADANKGNFKADVSALALEASLFDPATDSTFPDISALLASTFTAALVDLIWDEDSTGHYTSPQMAFISAQTSAGSTPPTVEEIARGVWTIAGPDDSSYTAGTMGKDAEGWDLTGASGGVDSTVLSNVLKRVIFGIAIGSGNDSLTLAQRLVLAEDISATAEAGIYSYFTSGSNEDQFKATGFSTHSAADVWASGTRTLSAFGFGVSLAAGEPTKIGDTAYAVFTSGSNEDAFKADVSALATTASLLNAIDSINAILDSLQLWDDEVATIPLLATSVSLNIAIDSINAILDTLQDGVNGPDVNATATVSAADMAAIADSVDADLTADHGSGSWQSGSAGTGGNTMYFFAIDTSGTDDSLSYVNLTFYNTVGSRVAGPVTTGDDGSTSAALPDGSNRVVPLLKGYTFSPTDSTFTASDGDTITLYCYNSNPNGTMLIYGYIYDADNDGLSGVKVLCERLGGGNAVDSVGSVISSPTFLTYTTTSDGYFGWTVPRSQNFADTSKAKYTISARYRGREILSLESLTVPPTGDALDISDSLLAR